MTRNEREVDKFYGEGASAQAKEPFPDFYRPYRANPAYVLRESLVQPRFEMSPAHSDGPLGVRWHYGPLRFERFETDVEPAPSRSAPLRLVLWQRLVRQDRPRGWWPGDRQMGMKMGGVSFLGKDGDYTTRWRSHARRQLRRWKKLLVAGEREVVPMTLEEFLAGYAHADQTTFMKILYPPVVRMKSKAHGEHVRFIGTRRPGGPIDAALATIDVPECETSIHLAAYMGGTGKADDTGTGLIDEWFRECRSRGIRVLDFGHFWSPGDLSEYKGYSRFKSQFDVRMIPFPRPLVRLMGRWWGGR